jgi:hypothetical protein
MKNVSRIAAAAAAALLLGAAPAFADNAPASSTPKGQISSGSAKDIQAAQKALGAKDFDAAVAALDKVKANTKKNDYDEFVMNEFYFSAYAGQKKFEEAAAPLEAMLASKYLAPDELKQRVEQGAFLYYQLKNYAKTIELGSRATTDGYASPHLQAVMADAYYLKEDYPGADHYARGMVENQIKAGQVPGADILELGLSAVAKQKDEAGEIYWLEQLVSYHPTPAYWEDLLDFMYHSKLTDRQTLQLYRLSAEVGALKRGSDYAEMAQLAVDAGSPGEAVTVLTQAFAANAFTDATEKSRSQHLLDSARKLAASDQPTLPKTEASVANAATGDGLVGVGIGYFGYGDYANAAKDISAGLAKGTSKDATDGRLLLGIAQLKSGNKDAANQTFKSVQGDPVYARLAALWMLRAKT